VYISAAESIGVSCCKIPKVKGHRAAAAVPDEAGYVEKNKKFRVVGGFVIEVLNRTQVYKI